MDVASPQNLTLDPPSLLVEDPRSTCASKPRLRSFNLLHLNQATDTGTMVATVFVVDDDAQVFNTEAAVSFFSAVDRAVGGTDSTRLAFDCEGVNLSRLGSLEIVSLCFEDSASVVYLVDLGDKGDASLRTERVTALKKVFESSSVEKVIHDCRMDADALYHICSIELRNVHDTSCYQAIVTGKADANLNDTLEDNGISVNVARDKMVYKINPAFWAMRPLTDRMIEWASSDVDKLLRLASKQILTLEPRGEGVIQRARDKSDAFATLVVGMKVDRSLRCRVPFGRFIGPRGSNIRSLQTRSGTVI